MDRRSWLWRRKSSDKSSGETESSGSGSLSLSSPSDRFSDEQQAYSNQNTQSPEVTSKVAPPQDEDVNDRVKILTEKLSAALSSITAKEELVKQHSKVAEEAVTGWEKAENEVITLKQQLDVSTKKNSMLEDKVVHLDGALKECLRQLRQVREEQDQKLLEAVSKKSEDTDSKTSDLQAQISDLRAQLETARAKAEATEKELEIRTLERDLSTKTAETASKQHLESMKKVAKLEAECRRLRTVARKATSLDDHKSAISHSDIQSGDGEKLTGRGSHHFERHPLKNNTASSSGIGLMDDFLEMEKLAAVPARESGDSSLGKVEASVKAELEAMRHRTTELEEKIEMLEAEKVELGMTLTQCQDQLELSETKFNECQNQLRVSQAQLNDANKKLGMLQAELGLANELRQAIELELEDANVRKEEAESRLKPIEDESGSLISKCRTLEREISRMKHEIETQQAQLASMKESNNTLEKELLNANAKREAAESQLKAVEAEVKSLLAKISALENEAEKEKRCFEEEISRMKRESDTWESRLASVSDSKEAVELELKASNAKRREAEIQLEAVEAEAKSLLSKVGLLEREAEKERSLSAEFGAKCKKLEIELSKVKFQADVNLAPVAKELDLDQEKELAVAASKLADCQKTIASLGKQLKSLATLEDLFLDIDKPLDISDKESQLPSNGEEGPTSSPLSSKAMAESDPSASETIKRRDNQEFVKDNKEGLLSSLALGKTPKNGVGKLFPRSKSAMKTRIHDSDYKTLVTGDKIVRGRK